MYIVVQHYNHMRTHKNKTLQKNMKKITSERLYVHYKKRKQKHSNNADKWPINKTLLNTLYSNKTSEI